MLRYFYLLGLVLSGSLAFAQTVVLDHETPETTTTFQYFGSSLEGALNQTVTNPNPTGVNTSANVGRFDKPAGSQVWAGAFSNPAPATPVVLSGATEVCVDVHMDRIGNLALKLEGSSTGGNDWLQTRANTVMNAWEQLCFDVTQNSEEAPFTTAAGQTYGTIVLFFDFGTAFDTDNVYYFDNIVHNGAAADMVDITFNVATSNIDVDDAGIFIAGGGNFGNPGDNGLTDDDGDGVYTITLSRPVGFASYYTFTNGACPDYGCKEDIGGQDCADPNNFNDRFLPAVSADTTINTCFGECSVTAECTPPSGDSVTITFVVATGDTEVADSGLFIVGGGNFGAPGEFPLTDNGDGTYQISVRQPEGFSSYYAFANGACPDFSCKENLSGQDCADPNNFNDRFLPAVFADTTISTCYGQCTDLAECMTTGGGDSINITFLVGTSNIDVSDDGIFIAGGGNFGVPGDFPLTDDDGDGIYTVTVRRPVGFFSYYNFANGACADFSCKENLAGQSCADPAVFNDRFLPAVSADTIIATCFGLCTDDATSCGEPLMDGTVTFTVDLADYDEPFTGVTIAGQFNGWDAAATPLRQIAGTSLWTIELGLPAGSNQYKYTIDGGAFWEDFGGVNGECTVQSGDFIDRVVVVDGDAELETFCFNSCAMCDAVGVTELSDYGVSFRVRPTLTSGQLYVDLTQNGSEPATLQLVGADGRLLQSFRTRGTATNTVDVGHLSAGVYYIRLQYRDAVGVQRFIKR